MGALKRTVKNYIKKSEKAKKILNKLNEVAKQEESNSKRKTETAQIISKVGKKDTDVIYPLVKEYKYNKRIYNYLLEIHDGYKIRRWVIEQMYYSTIGRFPNLDDPKSLNEKCSGCVSITMILS